MQKFSKLLQSVKRKKTPIPIDQFVNWALRILVYEKVDFCSEALAPSKDKRELSPNISDIERVWQTINYVKSVDVHQYI